MPRTCVVDESHAVGVLGPGGRGAVVADAGLEGEVDVLIGTLGKSLGSYGAYVCADTAMVRYLINVARTLIHSTAPAPPAIAGALAALELLEREPRRVDKLQANASLLRDELNVHGLAYADGDTADRVADRRRRQARGATRRRARRWSAACSRRCCAHRRCRATMRGCA